MRTLMVVMVGVVVGLVGCATQKTQLTEEGYRHAAGRNLAVEMCYTNKWLSPELAAFDLNREERAINSWAWDPNRLAKYKEELRAERKTVNPDYCSKLALSIQQLMLKEKQNSEANTVYPTPQWTSPQQSNTYCNRIGSQVLCNTTTF